MDGWMEKEKNEWVNEIKLSDMMRLNDAVLMSVRTQGSLVTRHLSFRG